MNAEKTVRLQARSILKKEGWSNAVAVFFVIMAFVMIALFIQSIFMLIADVSTSLFFLPFEGLSETFSLENEESLATSVVALIVNNASFIGLALGFLLLFPVFCGMNRYFYLLANEKSPRLYEVFYYFTHKAKECLLLGLRYGILNVLKLLVCLIPTTALINLILTEDYSTLTNSILTLSAFVTGFAGIALWILWTSKSFLTVYLFVENDSLPVGFYVNESKRILSSNLNKSVRKLIFSFGGWFLFALTGVGLLYFVPYFETAAAISAKWIIKLDKEVSLQ